MHLAKIEVKNYRLLVNSTLNIDKSTTLIVGRNNTGKTSSMDFMSKILENRTISYHDYPLSLRKQTFLSFAKYLKGKLSYNNFVNSLPVPTMIFYVDYSLDSDDTFLGGLSPFIIDVDFDSTTAIIEAKYSLKLDDISLKNMFAHCIINDNGKVKINSSDLKETIIDQFSKSFELTIKAINPKNKDDWQIKTVKELYNLFPLYTISAERSLDETNNGDTTSLKPLISKFFSENMENLDEKILTEVTALRSTVEKANRDIQRSSTDLLSSIIDNSIGFGYPNTEELQLGVQTKLSIDNQISDRTELTYSHKKTNEKLPSSYNGLGYKNLIKIEFQLAEFSRQVKETHSACIPLLFIEEPESHMHPQMQQNFISYLETFLSKISDTHIQVFLTSHSAHISNTIDFSKIRYVQKKVDNVIFKDLSDFTKSNAKNIDFIKKYLTISRCDLFFADKAILIEGSAERLLIPDMIRKCDNEGLFKSQKYKLTSQYYTLIEIGGAYAHIFMPFMDFLSIPTLIITDVDSIGSSTESISVSKGVSSSNATIKHWVRNINNMKEADKVPLANIMQLSDDDKTIKQIHIEYQTNENGLCGRSLEDAIMNVNRSLYDLPENATEEDIKFSTVGKKADFALDLIFNKENYNVPQYIKNGLSWLNNQLVTF